MLLAKYTSDWITLFQSIKDKIENVLGGNTYVIDHVVSTSVPLLDAKSIIGRVSRYKLQTCANIFITDREILKRSQNIVDDI